MTTKEIFELNRESHKGTFMDRSWRKASEESIATIQDPSLTSWQKFKRGAYTYQGISTHMTNRMAIKRDKVVFLEDILNRKE